MVPPFFNCVVSYISSTLNIGCETLSLLKMLMIDFRFRWILALLSSWGDRCSNFFFQNLEHILCLYNAIWSLFTRLFIVTSRRYNGGGFWDLTGRVIPSATDIVWNLKLGKVSKVRFIFQFIKNPNICKKRRRYMFES